MDIFVEIPDLLKQMGILLKIQLEMGPSLFLKLITTSHIGDSLPPS